MPKNLIRLLVLLLSVAIGSVQASTLVNWNLSSPEGNDGTSYTFISSPLPYTLTAYGFETKTSDLPGGANVGTTVWNAPTASAVDLFGKQDGAGDTGLGLSVDASNNIVINSFIQLSLTSFYQSSQLVSAQISVTGVTHGEGFYVWGSNTKGDPGTLLKVGTSALNGDFFNVPDLGDYKYISISSSTDCGSVLLNSDVKATFNSAVTPQFSPAPEPGSMSLVGLSLIALAFLLNKRFKP